MITYIEYNQAFGSKLLLHVHKLLVILHPVDNELYILFIYPDLYQPIEELINPLLKFEINYFAHLISRSYIFDSQIMH